MHESVFDYVQDVSDGSSSYKLYFPVYRGGGFLNVQIVSAWDEDNAVTRIRIGVERENKILWLKSFETVAAGQVVMYDNHVFVPTDYRVVVEFVGSSSGDKLYASLGGLAKYPKQ